MWQPSAEYIAEIAKGEYDAVAKVEVWKGDVWQATIPVQPGANVDVDETRQVRRTLSATVMSEGRPIDEYVPNKAGDLLHPDTGNELRPFRGVVLPSGETEWIPLGIFGMTKPVVKDTGDALSIALSGLDRSGSVSAQGWNDPYSIADGTNLGTAVMALLENRLPGGTYNFAPTDYGVPASVFGTSTTQQGDPYADATTLVTAGAMELFFDVSGTRVMRPISNPATDPIMATFKEGEGSKLIDAGRTLDETQSYKGVIVIGNGTGGPPVRGEAWVDPSNPGGRAYKITTALVPFPGQLSADAIVQANAIAESQLHIVCLSLDQPQWSAIPDATVQEGDCIDLIRLRAELNTDYAVSAMRIPLDVNVATSYTGRPRRSV